VLTTYNIVSREVIIPEHLKDKHAADMPATDAALVHIHAVEFMLLHFCPSVCLLHVCAVINGSNFFPQFDRLHMILSYRTLLKF